MIDCIILAGGTGQRCRLGFPKQFLRLGGIPVLIRILQLFRSINEINKIIIACVPEYIKETEEIINKYNISNYICIEGGKNRQESTYNALQYVTTDRVIIHESVRPFVTVSHIKELLDIDADAVVPCVPIIPTVANKNGYYLNRNDLVNIQLPQVFNTSLLKNAHYKAIGKDYTDDSSLLYGEFGVFPLLVKGLEENIKITTKIDTVLAVNLYEQTNCLDNRGF
jgi:2-C-methyl-D-erythritol 4-phosphate cytidylyltransferase